MERYKQNAKLMAKNSAVLYIQMAVKMLISLYTVRVILHVLGAEDYGIYNVVAGFVTMFGFLTGTLVSASQRFFAYAIGKGEYQLLNRYFNSSLLCFIILSVSLLVVMEIIGYWFVNYKLIIPEKRLEAANWVLQLSIVAFFIRILSVPFSALVVAFENMFIYAFVNMLDSILMLAIAIYLSVVVSDKLITYSILMLIISFINLILFFLLCRHYFRDFSVINLKWDSSLLKELLIYCGWYMFGSLAVAVRSQGINILLNMFFNPVVNAARAIAFQVNNAVNQFVDSFYQAVRPQITKLTAAKELEKMQTLVFNSSVISFLLMCLVAVPLLIEMPFVLSIWLEEVPEYTIIFSRLVLVTAMIDTLGLPLTTAVCASGKIKYFQIVVGTILILNLPVSYIMLNFCPHPFIVFYVSIFFSIIAQVIRIWIMKCMFQISITRYFYEVLFRIMIVSFLSLILTFIISHLLGPSLWMHLLDIVVSGFVVSLLTWYFGLTNSQKHVITSIIKRVLVNFVKL